MRSYEPSDVFKQCPGCGEYCGCRVEPRERCKVCRGTTFGTTFTATAPAVRTCNGCGAEAPRHASPRQSDGHEKGNGT